MRTRWLPHLIAAGITVPFAIWVVLSDIRGVLPWAAWLLPLAAAYYLGLRIGRELVRGIRRAAGDELSGRWTTADESPDMNPETEPPESRR